MARNLELNLTAHFKDYTESIIAPNFLNLNRNFKIGDPLSSNFGTVLNPSSWNKSPGYSESVGYILNLPSKIYGITELQIKVDSNGTSKTSITYDQSKGGLKFDTGLYSTAWISALGSDSSSAGSGSSGSSGTGSSAELLTDWSNYSSVIATQLALGANLAKDMKDTLDGIVSGTTTVNANVPTASSGDSSNAAASTEFVQNEINSKLLENNAMLFKGTVAANSQLPTSGFSAGWTYKVTVDGTYAGQEAHVGDLIIAITDNEGTTAVTPSSSYWVVVHANEDGTVTSTGSFTAGSVAVFSDNTGTVIKRSTGAGGEYQPIWINSTGELKTLSSKGSSNNPIYIDSTGKIQSSKITFNLGNGDDDFTLGVFTGAKSSADGTAGIVPKPVAGDDTRVLCGAGDFVGLVVTADFTEIETYVTTH